MQRSSTLRGRCALRRITVCSVVPLLFGPMVANARVDSKPARTITDRLVLTRTGVIVPVVGRRGDLWTVKSPCGATVTLPTVERVVRPTVVLDPGHGGDELGAQGSGGLLEKDVNLAVARETQRVLEADGFPTVLTRTADYRVPLTIRGTIMTSGAPRAFVSIHHNSEADGPREGPGTEVYYQHNSSESRRLSGLIYEEVLRALSTYRISWSGDRDAGVKTRLNSRGDDYYGIVRRGGRTPTALAELAFMSNPLEENLLRNPDVQRVEGAAVARGIERFLTTKDPGTGFVDAYPRTSPAGPGGGFGGCVDPPLQ